MRTENSIRPAEKMTYDKGFMVFNDLSSIVEEQRQDEIVFIYQSYQLTIDCTEKYAKEHLDELYNYAVQKEYDTLANAIREKRNRLLAESDKYMALDRLDLDTSSAIKFLASLKNIFNNSYAKYRQELRDITNQPNYPYEVVFPTKPE